MLLLPQASRRKVFSTVSGRSVSASARPVEPRKLQAVEQQQA